MSCGVLIVIDKNGKITGYYDPSQGPYDGGDDTLVGVVNNSTKPVNSIKLSGPDIFGFDGDGLCTYIMCTWPNPYGYEGPNSSFQVTDANNGFVNFSRPLAVGASTYFSLEGSTPFNPFVVIHPSNLDHSDYVPNKDIGGLDFGNVRVGTSAQHVVTITNGGNSPLQISFVTTLLSSAFIVVPGANTTCQNASGQPVSVAPGDSCTIEVKFTPPAGAPEQTDELEIQDNAPGTLQFASLRGTGTAAAMRDGQAGVEQAAVYPATSPCSGHFWGWGPLSYSPEWLEGQVVEGHIATEDASHIPVIGRILHYAADYNFFVYPDQGYRGLLMPGNFLVNSEYTESEVGRIEIEWERYGPGRNGIPEFAWPTVGDKVKVFGWHILDCGHGSPDYRSELHPPLFVATYRNAALSPLGGWNGRLGSSDRRDDHEQTIVDVWASSYGGAAYGFLFQHPGQFSQPVSMYTYNFDVMAPPKPGPTATLATPVVLTSAKSNGTLTYVQTPDQRGYHFTLTFPRTKGFRSSGFFGASIKVRWTDPTAPPMKNIHVFRVQPLNLHIIQNQAIVGSEPWGLYAYINEVQRGSLLSGGGTNVNHETYQRVNDGDNIKLSSRQAFTVTTVDNQPLHVAFRASVFNASRKGCTWCGGGDPAGTASEFYDPSALRGTTTYTLPGIADLAGKLGTDEWYKKCPCYDITFSITRIR